MDITIAQKPSILFETVELIYMCVNQLDFKNAKKRFFLKHSAQMNEDDMVFCQSTFQAVEAILDEGGRDIDPEDPRLQYYFRELQGEGRNSWACLAQIMVYSFCEDWRFSLDDGLRECYLQYRAFSENDFGNCKIQYISDGAMSYLPLKGEHAGTLLAQMESLDIPSACKWEIYTVLMDYEKHMKVLEALIRPVAQRLEGILKRYMPQFAAVVNHWETYFATHRFQDFVHDAIGIEVHAEIIRDHTPVIWFLWLKCLTCSYRQNEHQESISIGVLIRSRWLLKEQRQRQSNILSIHRFLGEKLKIDILHKLSQRSYYGLELANELKVAPGTISKYLNTMFGLGLLNLRRENNRLYYRTDKEAVRRYLDELEMLMLASDE